MVERPDIDELLRFDPLHAAGEITGHSYKTDPDTEMLGLVLALNHNAAKQEALEASGDTTMSSDLARYLGIIAGVGFEQVLTDDFVGRWGDEERLLVFARRDGLLLKFDTFRGKSVNGGDVYFNWRRNDASFRPECSGSMVADDVWAGSFDCREALVHKVRRLETHGSFLAPWVARPFLWLLHYSDPDAPSYDHAAITAARIERLPDWVRAFMTPAPSAA
ncbi:MAG: hypothetical protein AB7P02_05125 [Alphaproteobacteria bacterium]